MSNQSTSTAVSITEESVPMPEELDNLTSSSGSPTPRVGYNTLLSEARKGTITNFLAYLKDHQQSAHTLAVKTLSTLKAKGVREDHPNAAKFRYIHSMWVQLIRTLYWNGEHPNEANWSAFENHRVLEQGHLDRLSTYDILMMVAGRPALDSRPMVKGIASLDFPGYGKLVAAETGYLLSINGQDILVNGEEMRSLLVQASSFQRVPYTTGCVMQAHPARWNTGKEIQGKNGGTFRDRITLDGISSLVPAGTSFKDANGDVHTLSSVTRMSMPYREYKAIMWSVEFARTGRDNEAGAMKAFGEVVAAALGESRVPNGTDDVEYCSIMSWYPKRSDQRQAETFAEGHYLYGYQAEDLVSLDAFKAARARVLAAKAERRAPQAQEKAAVATVTTGDRDPFMEDEDGDGLF